MRNKKIAILSAVIVIVIGLAAGIGMYFMQDDNSKPTPKPNDTANGTESYLIKDGVDIELNDKANKLEDEAEKLMESDPLVASDKYKEAAQAYEEAGNKSKAADMNDNASTAGSMTTVPNPEPGDAVITPAGSAE